jgi:hypothetical protein
MAEGNKGGHVSCITKNQDAFLPVKMEHAGFETRTEHLPPTAAQYPANLGVVICRKKVGQTLCLSNFSVQHDCTAIYIGEEWSKFETLPCYLTNSIKKFCEELCERFASFFVAVEAGECKTRIK